MVASTANEQVFSIDDHVLNNRRANLKESLSEQRTFFNSALSKKC